MPSPETLIAAGFPWHDGERVPTLYRAGGCSLCAKTGYRGRMALHEVMPMTEQLERLTVERGSVASISAAAHAEGMMSLRLDGMSKVLAGHTSLDEVLRVVV